ncbi:O-antigen ligase family protein [Paenibacillus gorillae]|uniref:O-antigen ligase family protein n=1 Tax=Paenibacillus gorillae TaxID=1243662 RepID=UPI0004BA11DC|nr:O-antigen ligase family protein [Paenibacillus gorillae]
MSARKKVTRSTIITEKPPLLNWILTIGLALFIIIFPFNKALFNGYEYAFETAIYNAAIYGFVLLAATVIYVYRVGWKLNNHRSLLSILVLLLPVVYWLSSMQAVSSYYAGFMVKVMFLMAALFLAAIYAGERLPARKIIEYATMLTCYIVVFYGLLILFGQEYFRDGMWLAHDGYRLASVFQYSNTYAGFLSAILLAAVYYAATCTRWYMRLANAIMLVPIFISFLLTYSRGAIVIIPVVILILVPFLRFAQQIAYIVYTGLTALLSVVILSKLTANTDAIAAIVQPTETKAPNPISMFDSLPIQSWLLLGAAALVNAGLILLIHKKLYPWLETKTKRLAERRWSFAAVPATIIIIGSLAVIILLTSSGVRDLLPDKIAARFENINLQQHSVLERWTFYEDGLKVSQDYPVLGAGGGGWQALYEQYQHNPYWSRQAHSYFIQTLVEVGWLGLLILIGLLAYIYWLYIRSYIRYAERRGSHFIFFIISLTLLLHSAIDFDMSYIYLSALVFISLGSMLAPYGKLMLINRFADQKSTSYSKIIYSSSIGLLTIILLITSIRSASAIRSFDQTINKASSGQIAINELLPKLNKLIKSKPNQSVFSLTKFEALGQAYDQTHDRKYLEEGILTLQNAKKHDPYNRSIISMLNDAFKKDGNLPEQLAILDEGVSKFQWDIQFYEKAVIANIGAMTSDAANKDKYRERVLELAAEVQSRTAQLATLPPEQMQGRSFSFTPETVQAIENLK